MMIMERRMEYEMKQNKAVLLHEKLCSIIVDAANESAFGLPHFVTIPKDK